MNNENDISPYQMMIKLAASNIHNQKKNEFGEYPYNTFKIAEVLSILFCKEPQEIVMDIILSKNT